MSSDVRLPHPLLDRIMPAAFPPRLGRARPRSHSSLLVPDEAIETAVRQALC